MSENSVPRPVIEASRTSFSGSSPSQPHLHLGWPAQRLSSLRHCFDKKKAYLSYFTGKNGMSRNESKSFGDKATFLDPLLGRLGISSWLLWPMHRISKSTFLFFHIRFLPGEWGLFFFFKSRVISALANVCCTFLNFSSSILGRAIYKQLFMNLPLVFLCIRL